LNVGNRNNNESISEMIKKDPPVVGFQLTTCAD
jgi:hypothetical protein